MHCIAPSEKDADSAALEKRLWDSADQFRANSAAMIARREWPS
jgi:type I restriction enzyme M protein